MTTTTKREPTAMQKRVLTFIKRGINSKNGQPTHRDLADHFGISYGSIQGHLLALQKKGCLTWIPGKARTFRILKA